MKSVITYQYPNICPQTKDVTVLVDGERQFVYATPSTDIVAFSMTGPVTVEVCYGRPVSEAALKPFSKKKECTVDGDKVTFTIDEPISLLLDVPGQRQLHIHANPVDANAPSPDQPGVHYFKSGQVYEVGELELKDNETLYIEGGAVVRGCLRAYRASNIRIGGYGIFDGGYFKGAPSAVRLFLFYKCDQMTIEDIILVEPCLWMVTLHTCHHVVVRRLKEVGECTSSDGIDVVSSHHVEIDSCFIRNNDDSIVIKAMKPWGWDEAEAEDTYHVRVKNCTLINGNSGSAMEIGHELCSQSVRDIVFENCDVVSVHVFGAAISIHNADGATVEDIEYNNIRVEHYYDKLIDFRIIRSMWGNQEKRGHVKNVRIKNVYVTNSIFNPGYSTSLMGGYDSDHKIEDVLIQNLYLNEDKVTDGDQLSLFQKQTANIRFE